MATLTPFLYRTRTIHRPLRLPGLRVFLTTSPSHAESTQPPRIRRVLLPPAPEPQQPKSKLVTDDWIPFDIPEDVPAGPPPGFEEDERSTITVSERKTFDRIFQEIAIRGQFGDLSKPAKKRQYPLKRLSVEDDAAVEMLMNPDLENLIPGRPGDVDPNGGLGDTIIHGGGDGGGGGGGGGQFALKPPGQESDWSWDDINIAPGSATIQDAASSAAIAPASSLADRQRTVIGSIFDQAAKASAVDSLPNGRAHASPLPDHHPELMRYPQTLRGAAERAMRVLERSSAASAAPSSRWEKSGQQRLLDPAKTQLDSGSGSLGGGLAHGTSASASSMPALSRAMQQWKQTQDASQAGGDKAAEKKHDPLWDVFAGGDDPLAQSLSTQTVRLHERARVERLMLEAPSDFALWDTMEEEVFSLPRRMGLEDAASGPKAVEDEDLNPQNASDPSSQADWHEFAVEPPAPARKTPGRKTRQDEAETRSPTQKQKQADGDGDMATDPRPELDFRTFGPLYSSHLLFGLRRLDQAFSQSSPLALDVLPRIKQLGLVSYVLGASTPFYNALMRLHFFRYGDISTMLNLLEEMGHAGMFMDNTSLGLIQRAKYSLVRYMQGSFGPFLQAVMSQPEFDLVLMQRLIAWETKVKFSIRDRMTALGH